MSTNTFTVGRLTKDLEYGSSNNGKKYVRGSIATSHPFDRKNTIFYNIVAFAKTAELIHQLIGNGGKGQEIVITKGFLEPGSYKKQVNGQEVTMYSITYVIQEFELVGGSGNRNQNNDQQQSQQQFRQNNTPQNTGWGNPPQNQNAGSGNASGNGSWGNQSTQNDNGWGTQVDIGDDDLPF